MLDLKKQDLQPHNHGLNTPFHQYDFLKETCTICFVILAGVNKSYDTASDSVLACV